MDTMSPILEASHNIQIQMCPLSSVVTCQGTCYTSPFIMWPLLLFYASCLHIQHVKFPQALSSPQEVENSPICFHGTYTSIKIVCLNDNIPPLDCKFHKDISSFNFISLVPSSMSGT